MEIITSSVESNPNFSPNGDGCYAGGFPCSDRCQACFPWNPCGCHAIDVCFVDVVCDPWRVCGINF